ncbi:MAG: hypothetical protein JEZ07_07050 [Phycisphaerae bacterium]|nr:hypothetical protein [Phycisphaerae bacterium]
MRKMFRYLLISVAIGLLVNISVHAGPGEPLHNDISVYLARDMILANPDIIIIDVREPQEYCGTIGHVPGAMNYPLNSGFLAANYQDFNQDDIILVICQSGYRSNLASNFLDGKGFLNIYDIGGGTSAWYQNFPTVGCVDSDMDGINDDLDNCPAVFNPSQGEIIGLADFAVLSQRWLDGGVDIDVMLAFFANWMIETN